nr:unnamed protein product [Spirometra erinaceieuropaei]
MGRGCRLRHPERHRGTTALSATGHQRSPNEPPSVSSGRQIRHYHQRLRSPMTSPDAERDKFYEDPHALLATVSKVGHRLILTSIYFRLPMREKATRMHPRSRQWHLLDYVHVRRRDQRDVLVTKAIPVVDEWTDHRLVTSQMRIRLQFCRRPHEKRSPVADAAAAAAEENALVENRWCQLGDTVHLTALAANTRTGSLTTKPPCATCLPTGTACTKPTSTAEPTPTELPSTVVVASFNSDCEDFARDQPTCRRAVKTGKATYETNRIAVAKAKREARKSKLSPPRNANTQLSPTCQRCQQTFWAPIRPVGHLRANCGTRTTPTVVSPSTSPSPPMPSANVGCPPEPPLPFSSSPTASTPTAVASVTHTNITHKPDTPTKTSTTTVNASGEYLVYTCPHCDRTFTSHIGLVGHFRVHHTETCGPVPGAQTCTRHILHHCPHSPRTFIHLMGLFGHMRIHESENDRSPDTPSTPTMLSPTCTPSPSAPTTTAANTDLADFSCPQCLDEDGASSTVTRKAAD